MRRILGCFIFFMIMTTSLIFAGNVYYVDVTNGNDLNDGFTPETAWQTISKVNSPGFSYSPGDSILFKRGEVWREQLIPPDSGESGNLITFGAYGSGDLPIIMGSNLLTSWTDNGGNVWYSDEPSTDPIVVWLDGLSYWEADSAVNVNSTDRWYYTGGRVYVYATSNPSTFYSTSGVECPTRNDAVYCNNDYVRLENLHIKYGLNNTLRFHTGAEYCEAVNLAVEGSGNYACFILNGTSYCTVDNCTINGDSKPDQNNALYLDHSTSNTVKNCTIRNGSHCTVMIMRAVNTIFEYNEVYAEFEFGRTIEVQRRDSVGSGNIVRYNYFHDSQSDDTPQGDSGPQWSGQDEEVYYNIFSGTQSWALQLWNGSGPTKNNTFYNNVFYGFDDQGIRVNLTTVSGANNNIFKNNIFMGNDSVNHYQVSFKRNNDIYNAIFINNFIYDPTTSSTVEIEGVARSVDYMETNHPSLWSDNLVADPLFVNATNDNFHLQSASPCIDSGMYVGLTEDYAGNTVPYGWGIDIGAYEYTGINPLYANISASPTSGYVPLTVNFTGNATGGTPPYTYNWNFADGTSSSEQNLIHTYSNAGDYTVTLTVTDSLSNQDNDSLIIKVRAVITPLIASFIASPTSGEVPLTVNFTGNATGGVLPYSYNWDFGDSTSSTEQNPTHTYSDPGDYTVILTVTDSESNQASDSFTINASAVIAPLQVSFTASPTSGEVPLTVNFAGNATGGVLPYSYSWNFGDSTSSSEQNPSHAYFQAGDYTVTLTVTDSQSNQDSDSLTINASVSTTPLAASFIASPTSGEVPLTVNFTGSVTGGVLPYSYSWDFGDGTSSSEQNPSHIYSQAGDYTVYLTVTDIESNQDSDSLIINVSAAIPAYLSCSPTSFYFGATTSGNETQDQYLRIINAGSGILTWNIEDDAYWLSCSPSSGTDRGEITVSVNSSGLPLGLYVATITVSSPEAYNSPQYVSVNLRVYEPEQESPPFGSLDTPVDGSTVSGSIPVTGWALDDIEVIRLEIKRNSDPVDPPEAIGPDGLVYIGNAVFVEGARPDVEKSYSDYPLNSRAGWGYMLLTNDLPYRGNGSFTIYTFAYDVSGQREEIGRKTILCDNANRVKPFGTIDTREQGESIGGSDYINFGWALTPLPKTIPKDGSTISVWVDGVQVGHPVYDQYREDIATLYPEYNNAQGAVGYYYLDTTQYENGVHTIAWSVMDDEGEADEIGARYFFINNIETGSTHDGSLGLRSIYREDVEERLRIGIKEVGKEYRPQVDDDREIYTKSILKIQIEEMEPLRIVLEESSGGNMEYIGWGENRWKALPIGSTLDREKGIFSWIPTPGFIGRYVLHFAVTDGSYLSKPLQVEVNVVPKSYD